MLISTFGYRLWPNFKLLKTKRKKNLGFELKTDGLLLKATPLHSTVMPFFLKIVFGFVIFKFPPFAIIGTFVESYLGADLLSSFCPRGQVAKNSSRPVICKGLLQTLAPGLFPTQSVSRLPHRLRLPAGRAFKSFGKRENRTLMKVWILNEISHLTL